MPTEPMPTDPTTPEPMSPESTTAAATTKNRKEPAYLFSEKQVAEKSELARRFLDNRTRLNENVHKADTILEGALPTKYKELMGLAASACLRCDDCIYYHAIQSYRLGRDTRRADGRT